MGAGSSPTTTDTRTRPHMDICNGMCVGSPPGPRAAALRSPRLSTNSQRAPGGPWRKGLSILRDRRLETTWALGHAAQAEGSPWPLEFGDTVGWGILLPLAAWRTEQTGRGSSIAPTELLRVGGRHRLPSSLHAPTLEDREHSRQRGSGESGTDWLCRSLLRLSVQ